MELDLKTIFKLGGLSVLLIGGCTASAQNSEPPEPVAAHAEAMYIANEGVLITRGDTKIMFDPLFDNTYGHYLAVPAQMRLSMMTGTAPFDGVDAVFISHFHGDHFAPVMMLEYLKANPDIQLVGPRQAIDGFLDETPLQEGDPLFDRMTAIDMKYGDAPVRFALDDIAVEAAYIPHSGWPTRRLNIQNLAFRVTLGEDTTVLHMGDADINDQHYASQVEYWERIPTDMAFPPYWYLQTDTGRFILKERIGAKHSVGTHVPANIPKRDEDRPDDFKGLDIFTEPGETRKIEP